MNVLPSIAEMHRQSLAWRQAGKRIGLVPTMGCLHEGHLSLVDIAQAETDVVVVSIFVNPTQFAPGEDFAAYPRVFERDAALCRSRGVDVLFHPDANEMYAPGQSTWVVEDGLSAVLCGRSRPTHFRGVTTVVTKLFNIVAPDVAVFGRKDAQQFLIIQRMVRDLNVPVRIVGAPIVREPDGLAMSSRNRYLSPDQRQRACSISRGLERAAALMAGGERDAAVLCAAVRREIAAAGGRVDYVDLVARASLQSLDTLNVPAVLAVAAVFGNTRLIDNHFCEPAS